MRNSTSKNADDTSARRICDRCVGEPYLKGLIQNQGSDSECFYCQHESKTFTIKEVADLIEQAFDDHYERTPTEPDGFEYAMQSDPEIDYQWQRKGDEVLWAIAHAAGIEQPVAKDILAVLQERHYDHEAAKMGYESDFDDESYYKMKDPGCEDFATSWREFENGLKREARFFSRSAQAVLEDIFGGVLNLRTNTNEPVVVTVGPGTAIKFLFRARVFAAEDEKLREALERPWKHLGPPPMAAASAGRMNARGISVFYGSTEPSTALAEVRPPVGSQVAIAKFSIVRSLRLLDVVALKSVAAVGSIFDPEYGQHVRRAKFLEILSGLISRPVMPNEEAIEYLTTQAVADFLATEIKLDGIIFPSVQVGRASLNVVLFHHASRVEDVELPAGAKLQASLEQQDSDGVYPEYRVWEEFPSEKEASAPPDVDVQPLSIVSYDELFDHRKSSLKVDLPSISIHHVTAVSFDSEAYSVARHRVIKPEADTGGNQDTIW